MTSKSISLYEEKGPLDSERQRLGQSQKFTDEPLQFLKGSIHEQLSCKDGDDQVSFYGEEVDDKEQQDEHQQEGLQSGEEQDDVLASSDK